MSTAKVAHVATVDLTLRFLLLGQLRALRDEGFEVVGISAPGPWVEDLEREGIRHIPWRNATRSWDPATDAKAFAELVRICRRERFDLVHTHNPKPGVLGRIGARLAGVPVVLNTVHGLYATPDDPAGKRAAVLAAEWAAARFSDLELFQSEEDLRWMRRLRLVSRDRSELLGNGTDLSRFDPDVVRPQRVSELRHELGLGDDLVVGTIGRMVAEKGYRELFAVARAVRGERPGVRFLVLGDLDADKADSLRPSEVERAAPDVTFLGWREEVAELLSLMDVFVLASWREGVPRSAIEAAAMGKPMVLTDIRGCREVCRDGIEGLLVPPRDPRALATAIGRLLDDAALRERMGEAARARAGERFDERRVAETVVLRTKELLGRAGRLGVEEDAVRVRPARAADAAAMARLHRESMPEAFLPKLGDGFLRRLYRELVRDPRGVTLVAERGPWIVGFAAGVSSVAAFYRRFLLRRGLSAAVVAAARLLRSDVLRRARETAAYPRAASSLPEAELLSIAVAPADRARGVGRELTVGVVEGLGRRGASEVKVVVAADNEPANRLYESIGFEPAGSITVHDGIASNVWVIPCPS